MPTRPRVAEMNTSIEENLQLVEEEDRTERLDGRLDGNGRIIKCTDYTVTYEIERVGDLPLSKKMVVVADANWATF